MTPAPVKPAVAMDLLSQIDIRVGTIDSVTDVAGSDKLVALRVDFGDHKRTIVAGLRQERADPREVEGRQALFVVNLEPRKIRGVVSEGMLFDIGYADGVPPVLAVPESPVPAARGRGRVLQPETRKQLRYLLNQGLCAGPGAVYAVGPRKAQSREMLSGFSISHARPVLESCDPWPRSRISSLEKQETMKIGIIGAGNIGATAARLFINAGHEIAISNSRGPDSLRTLVTKLGSRAHAMTVDEAARFGDLILLAVPWRSPEALPKPDAVAGKIVIDAMNPYKPDFTFYDLGDSTSSEETAKRLPGARLVKGFNTIYYQHLASRGRTDLPVGQRHAIFVAGDDREAKRAVTQLIEEIGFAPVDTGSLRDGGRQQQPGSTIYNKPMTGQEAKAALTQLAQTYAG